MKDFSSSKTLLLEDSLMIELTREKILTKRVEMDSNNNFKSYCSLSIDIMFFLIIDKNGKEISWSQIKM